MKTDLLASLRNLGARLLHFQRASFALLALLWIGLIAYLSSQTLEAAPGGPIWRLLGNGVHVPLFGFLALWTALALPRQTPNHWPRLNAKSSLGIILFVAANGAIDEWHQSFSGRTPAATDVLTDIVAATWVVVVATYVGSEQAQSRGLHWRLWGGALLCLSAAAIASI